MVSDEAQNVISTPTESPEGPGLNARTPGSSGEKSPGGLKSGKPQLHISMVNTFARCPVQFQRRYGARFDIWPQEEIIPPSVALGIGTSVHAAVELNMRNKMKEGELLPVEEVLQLARDNFEATWAGGMLLTDEEAARMDGTKGEAIDMSVSLSRLHHSVLAPQIQPEAVEEKFVVKLDGYPYDLAGKMDIREKRDIRDTKTGGKRDPDAPKTMQMRMYSLGHKVNQGFTPDRVKVDLLLKQKTVKHETYTTQPGNEEQWYRPLYYRIESMMELIDQVAKGNAKMPAADAQSWMCQKSWCGYALTCPAWSGK